MIDDTKLQFILKSVEKNSRTSVTLYERYIESMYAINLISSEVNKLLGILRISQSKVKAAASHFLFACVLSSFSDVSILQENADSCLSVEKENVLSTLRQQRKKMILQIHEDNLNYLTIWDKIVAALKISHLNYDIWVQFVDFALKL